MTKTNHNEEKKNEPRMETGIRRMDQDKVDNDRSRSTYGYFPMDEVRRIEKGIRTEGKTVEGAIREVEKACERLRESQRELEESQRELEKLIRNEK